MRCLTFLRALAVAQRFALAQNLRLRLLATADFFCVLHCCRHHSWCPAERRLRLEQEGIMVSGTRPKLLQTVLRVELGAVKSFMGVESFDGALSGTRDAALEPLKQEGGRHGALSGKRGIEVRTVDSSSSVYASTK